jgi:paraquat-inducible protein A
VACSFDAVGCRDCGLIQALPTRPGSGSLRCRRCGRVLERTNGRSLDGALACALTTLVLLFPANLLPLLRVDILQATNRSVVFSGVMGLWAQGWQVVAFLVGLELIVLPFLRFGSLASVLTVLRFGGSPPWLGPVFRWSERLDEWAMIDVFLLGGVVGYFRIAPFLPIKIEAGGWCLIAAALMTLVTRASLERRELWRHIGPVVENPEPGMIACSGCDLPVRPDRQGQRCPRCGETIWSCRPFSAMRAMALTVGAFVFYPSAYLYPMEYSVQLNHAQGYTIMTGVSELVNAHLWFFAALIFGFSVLTPLLKLFALAWFGVSIGRRSSRCLRFKTKLYRLVDEIGRWSHIDVFTVTVFLPLMQLSGFLGVVIGWALPAFLAVVLLTMLASSMFDPRALWRAGGVYR